MGCSGSLALVIGCAFRALLTTEVTPSLVNLMLPEGASGASSSEGSVNQQPVIPELHPPLLDDSTRRQELNDRFGLYLLGLSYNPAVRDSFVETHLQIEKHIEGALVDDGYSRESVFEKRGQIRGIMFYPQGTGLSESTYLKYLKQIRENGTRDSIPYRRIQKAIKNYDLMGL
ncbi:hypothetical protein RJ640_029073 [Escallonia rubra]|uniref:Uncharacterized protein n=1 Tax=Escallonia rubra TaxID=112253 RepID=A0AA88SAB5_9ASTE|nr:hypothetical protein RJ640_029073 [Escallonia rubra]